MRSRSARKDREMRERRSLMGQYPRCEIGPILAAANHLGLADARIALDAAARCAGRSHGCHERRKRSAGGALSGPNIMGACSICNSWVEDQPRIARLLGLVVRPGDDRWGDFADGPSKIVTAPRPLP